ncbi:MAG: SIS domain-containing protein, partial [SAR324 cluster bacterium]|nr:SIS domain-containing protein [SAR324 cluster bacterium]
FETLAEIKEKLAAEASLKDICHLALKQLWETDQKRGIVFSLGDFAHRHKAAHFFEELACRYQSGSAFGRPDRHRVRAECLNHKPESILSEVVKGYFRRDEDVLHTLVVFTGNIPSSTIKFAMQIAKVSHAGVLFVGGEGARELSSAADFSILIPCADERLILALQSVFVHGLCDGLEPECPSPNTKEAEQLKLRKNIIPKALLESAKLDRLISSNNLILENIQKARIEIESRLLQGGWLYLAGNGGSAADALELHDVFSAAHLSNGLLPKVKHLLDPCYLTCAYNDGMSPFAREMENESSGSVFLAYSTSGNSDNIIRGVLEAKKNGVYTIALTGKDGGELIKHSDLSIIVPSENTARIQEAHATIGILLLP